ncbi:HAD family hydrolase [Microbacterium sp. LRZ72]|uniref:HAD family hydrolase n=1 Tax=Microbacterium sp. LRZ72 TaxID=2942481 RepID=UPI0029B6BE68|nr:HAD family hydrolase [Microbacterium sp. LRZ72]MDX2376158.1 HAD family hydrolase [Microbacterium sp. LRZ72]
MTGTIVFDFDGTLALGRGPIVAYARSLAASADDEGFFARAHAAIDDFESGASTYRDGYHAVGALASASGIDPAALAAAYGASREALGTTDAAVHAPDGLAPFLERLSGRARLLLATNAPGTGIARVLDTWGVAPFFTATHFTVGKPEGLTKIIREALATGPVLSVGDIVDFDLVPAMQLGADTALVGVTAMISDAPVDLRGRTVADLYADIESWAAAASSSTPVPLGTPLPTERQS